MNFSSDIIFKNDLHHNFGKTIVTETFLVFHKLAWELVWFSRAAFERSRSASLLLNWLEKTNCIWRASYTRTSNINRIVSKIHNISTLCVSHKHFGTDLATLISMITSALTLRVLAHNFGNCLRNPIKNCVEFDLPLTMSPDNCGGKGLKHFCRSKSWW